MLVTVVTAVCVLVTVFVTMLTIVCVLVTVICAGLGLVVDVVDGVVGEIDELVEVGVELEVVDVEVPGTIVAPIHEHAEEYLARLVQAAAYFGRVEEAI